MWSCLNSKDLEEDQRRTVSMHLETFCRVLPLIIETCGRLLPPLEMMSSSNKAPPWSAKEVLHSSNLSQIRVATFTSIFYYLELSMQAVYIGNCAPMQTLIGLLQIVK